MIVVIRTSRNVNFGSSDLLTAMKVHVQGMSLSVVSFLLNASLSNKSIVFLFLLYINVVIGLMFLIGRTRTQNQKLQEL